MKQVQTITLSMLTLMALSFSGCGDVKTDKVLTAKSMTNKSKANYADNQFGLVDAKRVEGWISDWESNKPAGITGKLVVLQIGKISVGGDYAYIKNNGKDVLAYELGDICNTYYSRNDGVSNIAKAINSGKNIDGMMMKFGIDPTKDMLLFVQGNGLNKGKNLSGAARMWYTFSYWGFEQSHMAILNGNASYVLNPKVNTSLVSSTKSDMFSINSTVPDMSGKVGISALKTNATILQATMKEVRDIIDTNDKDALLLDTRSLAEFEGTKQAKTELKTCGINKDEQCYTPFDGHIKGAKHFLFTDVLDMTNGADLDGDGEITDIKESSFLFKSQDDIATLFSDSGYSEGKTIYTYCRTGTKASLVTFVASQLLGYPTRMYDGSWIQWGKMAHREDANGKTLIPADSAWRTDIEKYSENITYNGETSTVFPADINSLHLDSKSTDAIINEDIQYKKDN